MSLVDLSKSRDLKRLIESLTHSGRKDLNNEELSLVIEYCNESVYLAQAQMDILTSLKEYHSEVRYSAAQLCHVFFMKYEEFRNKLVKDLDVYFSLTLGIQTDKALPPPKAAAQALKKLTLENFLIWQETFPIPKLKRAIRYLQDVENVDFNVFDIVNPKERKEKEELEAHMMKLNKERLKKINEEMEDLLPEIRNTLVSLESCFSLLMPPPEEPELEELEENSEDNMRLYGIVSSKHTVQIELRNKILIKVDEENSSIIDAAKDSFTLINNRFLPKIKAWIEIISKAQGDVNSMKEALIIKSQLELAISKYHRLDIKNDSKNKSDKEDVVSSDSELEEVPEIQPSSKQKTNEEIDFLSSTLGMNKNEKEKQRNKVIDEGIALGLSGPSHSGMSERKKKLLEVAPKVPFDIDLYHWEDEKLPTPTILAVNSEGSRFWGGGSSEELSEIPVPDGAASLRTRVIEYVGKWEPINHTCRAPLPSGKLCPRKDRVKCPHHGLIVERDDKGEIINEEDKEKNKKSKPKPDIPDWQDPKLLAEIKAQTGLDLKMPEKGKRTKKKQKYPGLTNIKEIKDTPTNRISKKIFNKKSLKRVAETLDKIDHKKHKDKFGDQFNYVHGT